MVFLVQIQGFLFLCKTLQLDKFESADFKYGVVFKIAAQKHSHKAFSVLNLRIFILAQNFAFWANSRLLLSNVTLFFQNYSSIKAFRFFNKKRCILKISRVPASNMAMIFSNPCLKYPNKALLVPNLKIFCFGKNSWVLISNMTFGFSNFLLKTHK